MKPLFEVLSRVQGQYVGRGVNHEGQSFTGIFEARHLSQGPGVAFSFRAVGDEGAVYHDEQSLIGNSMAGKPSLWVLSSNHPGVFERTLKEETMTSEGTCVLVFGFGSLEDRASFREQVRLEISPSGTVKYVYFWGMPGGDFAERSGTLMKRA